MTDEKTPKMEKMPGVHVVEMTPIVMERGLEICARAYNAAADSILSELGLPSITTGIVFLHQITVALKAIDPKLASDYLRWCARTCLATTEAEMEALNAAGQNIYQRICEVCLSQEIMRRESGQERPS